jgi:integrase
VLDVAFKEGIIPRNYASAATPPKKERPKVDAITEKQLNVFFTALYSDKKNYVYQVFFSLLLACGCRVGELCALTWDNVDFNGGKVHICKHFVLDENGRHVEDGCKTTAGERWLYLDKHIMKTLVEYRAYYLNKAREYGTKWDNSTNAVFFSQQAPGNYLSPHMAREWLRAFQKRNNLPNIHPHQFRHTSISLQLQAGVSVPDAAKRAGHSRPDVTLSFYAHTPRNNDRLCCEAVTKVLRRLPKTVKPPKLTVC